jgi:hypothetical protein
VFRKMFGPKRTAVMIVKFSIIRRVMSVATMREPGNALKIFVENCLGRCQLERPRKKGGYHYDVS